MHKLLLTLAVLPLLLAGCASDDDGHDHDDATTTDDDAMHHADPVTHEVILANNEFAPGDFELYVGDSVHWVTQDLQTHNVVSTSEADAFRSDDLSTIPLLYGTEFTHTFAKAGVIEVICEYHSNMVVHLDVRDHNMTSEHHHDG